jgi:hypothetical protein
LRSFLGRRRIGTDRILLQQANGFACSSQILGTRQSDNTFADYQNIAVFFH